MNTTDMEKQVQFWRTSAEEDIDTGELLIRNDRLRHGLFFAHLALEKILKAHVTRVTQEVAPKIHSLARLAALSSLTLTDTHLDFLSSFEQFNIVGRYAENACDVPSSEESVRLIGTAKEVCTWLTQQL